MSERDFQRARSADAKDARTEAILASARQQAEQRSVREVTLTDVAAGVGMHKSTMLRYFETREEIFLRLAAHEWTGWAAEVTGELAGLDDPDAGTVARLLASSLARRPLFCDLLAHVPLSLEHGVSLAAVKGFKMTAIASAGSVAEAVSRACDLRPGDAMDVVATATAMAGALWQMAAPGTTLRRLYETDPELGHALVDVEPRLSAILAALLRGSRDAEAEALSRLQS